MISDQVMKHVRKTRPMPTITYQRRNRLIKDIERVIPKSCIHTYWDKDDMLIDIRISNERYDERVQRVINYASKYLDIDIEITKDETC